MLLEKRKTVKKGKKKKTETSTKKGGGVRGFRENMSQSLIAD